MTRILLWMLFAGAASAQELPATGALGDAFCAPLHCEDPLFGGCSSLRCAQLELEMVAGRDAAARAQAKQQYASQCVPKDCPIAQDAALVAADVQKWKQLKQTPLGCGETTDVRALLLADEIQPTPAATLGAVGCAANAPHAGIRELAAQRNWWRCEALRRPSVTDCQGRCGASAALVDAMGVAQRRWCPASTGAWGLCATRSTGVQKIRMEAGIDSFGVICPPPDDVPLNCPARLTPPLPSDTARKLSGEGRAEVLAIGVLPDAANALGSAAPLSSVQESNGLRVVTRPLIAWSMASNEAPTAFVAISVVKGAQGSTIVREVHAANGSAPSASTLTGWSPEDLRQQEECSLKPLDMARGELIAWQQELAIADANARPWAEMPIPVSLGDRLRRCYHRSRGDVCVELQVPAVIPPPAEARLFVFSPAFLTSLDAQADVATSRAALAAYLQSRSTPVGTQRLGVLVADGPGKRAVIGGSADGFARVAWHGTAVQAEPVGPTVEAVLAPLSNPATYQGQRSDAAARAALRAVLELPRGVLLSLADSNRSCYLTETGPRCHDGPKDAPIATAAPSEANGLKVFANAYTARGSRSVTAAWAQAQQLVTRSLEPVLKDFRLLGVVQDDAGQRAVFSDSPAPPGCWANLRVVSLQKPVSPGPTIRWAVAKPAAQCRADGDAAFEAAFVEKALTRALADLQATGEVAHLVLPADAKGELMVVRGFSGTKASLSVARPEVDARALADVQNASGYQGSLRSENELHAFLRCLVAHDAGCTTRKVKPIVYFPGRNP